MDQLEIARAASEAILSSNSASPRIILGARQGLALQAILRGDPVEAQASTSHWVMPGVVLTRARGESHLTVY